MSQPSSLNENSRRSPFNLFRTFFMVLFLLINLTIGALGSAAVHQAQHTVALAVKPLVFAAVVGFISAFFVLPTLILDVLRWGAFKAAFWAELLCFVSFICLDLSVVAAAFTVHPGSQQAFCTVAKDGSNPGVCKLAVALFALIFFSASITFLYLTTLIARIVLRYHRAIWRQTVSEYHWAQPVQREQKILDLFGNPHDSEPYRFPNLPHLAPPTSSSTHSPSHTQPHTPISFQHPLTSWSSWPIDTTKLPPAARVSESYSPSVIPRTPITATTPSSVHSPHHADQLFNKFTHDSDAEEVCLAKYGKPCSCSACKQAILGLEKYQLNHSATRV